MKQKVDFKEVVNIVRYDVLGTFSMLLPQVFENLSDEDKLDYYKKVFDLYYDACSYLQANLNLDELNEKYGETK